MRRYALRDDQWERIQDLLPGRVGHVGVTAQDNRLFVEAVLYRYRAGIPWRDLRERFGCGVKVQTPGQTHEGLRSYGWVRFGEVTGAETLQNPERDGISRQIADLSRA